MAVRILFGERVYNLIVSSRASFALSAQFFNIFNHVLFSDPSLSFQSPNSFGVITSQSNSPRRIEMGIHIDF